MKIEMTKPGNRQYYNDVFLYWFANKNNNISLNEALKLKNIRLYLIEKQILK